MASPSCPTPDSCLHVAAWLLSDNAAANATVRELVEARPALPDADHFTCPFCFAELTFGCSGKTQFERHARQRACLRGARGIARAMQLDLHTYLGARRAAVDAIGGPEAVCQPPPRPCPMRCGVQLLHVGNALPKHMLVCPHRLARCVRSVRVIDFRGGPDEYFSWPRAVLECRVRLPGSDDALTVVIDQSNGLDVYDRTGAERLPAAQAKTVVEIYTTWRQAQPHLYVYASSQTEHTSSFYPASYVRDELRAMCSGEWGGTAPEELLAGDTQEDRRNISAMRAFADTGMLPQELSPWLQQALLVTMPAETDTNLTSLIAGYFVEPEPPAAAIGRPRRRTPPADEPPPKKRRN